MLALYDDIHNAVADDLALVGARSSAAALSNLRKNKYIPELAQG